MKTEIKHTREYADKLAEKLIKQQPDLFLRRKILSDGYMKALEETAAPELLEALIKIKDKINKEGEITIKGLSQEADLIFNAIEKATTKI